jgi:hypothetical protein
VDGHFEELCNYEGNAGNRITAVGVPIPSSWGLNVTAVGVPIPSFWALNVKLK